MKTLTKSWTWVQDSKKYPSSKTTIKIRNCRYCWGNPSRSQAKGQKLMPIHFWVSLKGQEGQFAGRIAGLRSCLCCFFVALGRLLIFPAFNLCICGTGLVMRNSAWHRAGAAGARWPHHRALSKAHTAPPRPSGPEGRGMTVALVG